MNAKRPVIPPPGLIRLAAVAALVLGSSVELTAASRKPQSNEPFNSFAVLDRQLTVLDQQFSEAKTGTNPKEVDKHAASKTSRPWAQAARTMQPSVSAIVDTSYRLEHLYRARERRLHHPMFKVLYRRARALRGDLRLLTEARTARWAGVVEKRLSQAIIAYVFEFQLVSGGYAALRCQPGQLGCCEPVRKDPEGPFSCRWMCLKPAGSCRSGFPGPTIPSNFERPLTASP